MKGNKMNWHTTNKRKKALYYFFDHAKGEYAVLFTKEQAKRMGLRKLRIERVKIYKEGKK
jgi:hypothetical protein